MAPLGRAQGATGGAAMARPRRRLWPAAAAVAVGAAAGGNWLLAAFVTPPAPSASLQPAEAPQGLRRAAVAGALAALLPRAEPASAAGACTEEDKKTYASKKSKWDDVMGKCVTNTDEVIGGTYKDRCIRQFFSQEKTGASCMSNCVVKSQGLSKGCGDCWGSLAACTAANCASECLDANAPNCKTCVKKTCGNDFQSCSGIEL